MYAQSPQAMQNIQTQALSQQYADAILRQARSAPQYRHQQFNAPAVLFSPEEMEKIKQEKKQFAEDIAYTVNHAVSCMALDLFGGSPIGSKLSSEYIVPNIQKSFENLPYLHRFSDKEIHLWCSHGIGKWTVAEVAGDMASVIPTIALQRYAPGVFDAMEAVLEPTLGWAYKSGAEKAAKKWARENGLPYDDPRVLEHQETLYNHEVKHLPHAFIWGGVSLPISGEILTVFGHDHDSCGHNHGHGHGHSHGKKSGGCGHKHHHHHHGHGHSHGHWKNLRNNMLHVLGGKIFSSAILLGARSIAPDQARKWDGWASDNFYYPVTKGLTKLFGVDEETVRRVHEEHRTFHSAANNAANIPTIIDSSNSNINYPVKENMSVASFTA